MRFSDPTGISGWHRIDARITTSGQPREEQLADLAALGVSHVINLGLHSHEKALPDEAASVAALGMTYIHIPVEMTDPTEADYMRFREAMAALEGRKVHVHCIANMRVSAFFYRWQRERGMDEAKARAAMETFWRPGGVWAALIGDGGGVERPYQIAGKDY